jgi:hypothetical protein
MFEYTLQEMFDKVKSWLSVPDRIIRVIEEDEE